jgi:hypothetical protein
VGLTNNGYLAGIFVLDGKQRESKMIAKKPRKKKIPCSAEHRKHLSEAGMGQVWTPERRHNMSLAAIKRGNLPRSPETRKKMSISHTGQTRTDEQKQNISKSLKGKLFTEEHIKNLKGRKCGAPSVETKKKLSDAGEKNWQDPEYAAMMCKAQGRLPNKAELKLNGILSNLYPGEWKYVGDGQFFISGKCPDFVNVNGQKKIIELFGDYWHKGQNPQDRIDTFKPFGYDTLIVWENELKNFKSLRRKIFDFAEQDHKQIGQQ